MIDILGFNMILDNFAFFPRPTGLDNLTSANIQNGIFDNINITKDTSLPYSYTLPVEWDSYTVLNCNFEDNINGGEYNTLTFDSVKIKRRIKGSFDWVTLIIIYLNDLSDLVFTVYDYFAKNNTDYEYAFVPITNGAEGEYIIISITSKFIGNFIADSSNIYEFYTNSVFEGGTLSNKTGIFEPLNSKYPVIISNNNIKYKKGSFTGDIISKDELNSNTLDLSKNVPLQKIIEYFLSDKKAKIIKDWNGKSLLVMVVDDVTITPNNNMGGRICSVTFNYVEMGDTESSSDLENNGLIQYIGDN